MKYIHRYTAALLGKFPWMVINRRPISNLLVSTEGRDNNFDMIRFIAASAVVVSHAFPLTRGTDASEPIHLVSHGQTSLGGIAVGVFFIISGYLISRSYENNPRFMVFAASRALRLLPALVIVALLSAFVLGPVITSVGLTEYFRSSETYQYLSIIWMRHPPYTLPGIFTNNIYPVAVNGSIWTLQYEVICYFLVGILGITKLLNRHMTLLALLGLTLLTIVRPQSEFSVNYILFASFMAGMLFYFYRSSIPRSRSLLYASIILIEISLMYGSYFRYILPIPATYIILYFSFTKFHKLSILTKYGDFSYGLYIYAFPIQQIISMMMGNRLSPLVGFLITYPIALVCAAMSWHLIEKPTLSYKRQLQQSVVSWQEGILNQCSKFIPSKIFNALKSV